MCLLHLGVDFSALYQLHLVKSETARIFIPKELKLVEAFGYSQSYIIDHFLFVICKLDEGKDFSSRFFFAATHLEASFLLTMIIARLGSSTRYPLLCKLID